MKLKFLLLIFVLSILLTLGCVNNKDEVIYSNPNYPYFNITNVRTDIPEINHYTLNLTITNNVPEKTIKCANGSIINTGVTSTETVTILTLRWWDKYNAMEPYKSNSFNATLAYNETKVFTFDIGALAPGNYSMIVSTPSMNTTYNTSMWDYSI